MDHLPGVEKALSPPLVVPYLGRQGYDGQSFTNYFSRRGWDLAFLDRDDFTNNGTRTTVETAVILQDWLYFGMIHEILGQTHLEYLAWDAKCGLIITTRSLPEHLEMWFSRVSLMTPEQGRLELEKSRACLLEVDTVVTKHLREDHICDWPLSSEISLSILILMETLDEARQFIHDKLGLGMGPRRTLQYGRVFALEKRMVDRGWCPNQVTMCRSRFGTSALCFSSLLARPLQRRHDSCSERECVAYQVLDDSAVTRHVRDGCCCKYIAAPGDQTESLVRKASIPLVRMRGANCRHLSIEIIEHEPDQEFVAISHVWSHGLGNGVSNSLPLCQIQRVFDLVSEISKGPVLFWLDTLCVPREPFGLRRLAIEQIKTVYEAATKVLVLDEELANSEYFENTYEESLMRINLSGWARRLWTLHEATRSRHIYYRFSNGNIKQEHLIERWHNNRPDAEGSISKYFNVTGKRAISILANISQLREEKNGRFQMARLWTLLRWRVTSWAEDETICMANMMNVCDDVVNDLLRTSPEIRMSKFLALFDVYPAAMLFMSGPKINEDGLRWAPTSWLIRSNNEQEELEASGQRMARLGKAGLIISCDSLLLNFGVKALCQRGRVSFLLATDTRSLCVVRRYNKTDDSVTIQLMQSKTIAICLDRPLGIFLQERQCKGALVAVRRVEKTRGVTTSFSRFLCNVFIFCILHENSRQALGEMSSELDDYSGDIVSPELAGDSRLWCIG